MWSMKKLQWVKNEKGEWFTQSITHEYRIIRLKEGKYLLRWFNKVTHKNVTKTGFTSLQEVRDFVENEHVPEKLSRWFDYQKDHEELFKEQYLGDWGSQEDYEPAPILSEERRLQMEQSDAWFMSKRNESDN